MRKYLFSIKQKPDHVVRFPRIGLKSLKLRIIVALRNLYFTSCMAFYTAKSVDLWSGVEDISRRILRFNLCLLYPTEGIPVSFGIPEKYLWRTVYAFWPRTLQFWFLGHHCHETPCHCAFFRYAISDTYGKVARGTSLVAVDAFSNYETGTLQKR